MKNNKILYWSITVAIAGFLFGFDTIVISGADQPIQKLWNTTPLFHGTFIMSVALWGTVIGALFANIPCNYLGRKRTLFWVGVLYSVSAIGSALAPDPISFSIFRLIGGIGVGASSVAAPTYISEVSPAANRGRLVAAYQFNIVLGVLAAYLSNYMISIWFGPDSWRIMLGIEGIPAIIFTFLVLGVPNSPRWLMMRGKSKDLVMEVLSEINANSKQVLEEFNRISKSFVQASKGNLFSRKYRFLVFLAFSIAFFNQLSGINFVLYYAPRIFESAGVASGSVIGASIPLGITNLIGTIIGVYLIDRIGRKPLMLIGSFGYIITLLAVTWAFYTEAKGGVVVVFVAAFVGAHALAQGAVIWVYISEIFPNRIRDVGMSFGASTHWICAAIITLITPLVISSFSGATIFGFFTFMTFLQLLWVIFIMPETKGIKLEDLEEKLLKTDGNNNNMLIGTITNK